MKFKFKFHIKSLLLLLMIFGMGRNLSFGAPAEFRSLQKHTGKNFNAVQPVLAIFKENTFQEFPEPSEDLFFGISSPAYQNTISLAEEARLRTADFCFRRDLRTEIFQQLFPTHFFL